MSIHAFKFFTIEDILDFHKYQITLLGGSSKIFSLEQLDSAVAAPQATWGGEYLYRDAFEIAATYLYGIVLNHPFADGNKRTATHACLLSLIQNGWRLDKAYKSELTDIVLKIACGELGKEPLVEFLRKHSYPVQE